MNKLPDVNVRPVIAALRFTGLKTLGSCGGHKHPTKWQHPFGKWFVSFEGHVARIRRLKKLARKLHLTLRRGKPNVCTLCLKCDDHLIKNRPWYYLQGRENTKDVAKEIKAA